MLLCINRMILRAVYLVTQSCPPLYDPTDCSPPGYSAHGVLKARILEWVSMPSPGGLPNTGTEPRSPTLQVIFYTQANI